MPNRAYWNEDRADGNLTKSRKINSLIAAVKKKETRGVGKKSSADRAFTDSEFIQIVDLLGNVSNGTDSRRYLAMIKFQMHLIRLKLQT